MPGRRSSLIWPELGRRLLDELAGAVGAVVVDDQHVGVGQRRRAPRRAGRRRSRARCTSAGRRSSGSTARPRRQASDGPAPARHHARVAVGAPTTAWNTRSTPRRRRVPRQRAGPGQRGGAQPRAGGRRRSSTAADAPGRGRPAGASTPVTPSTTEQRWPLMSVATAGVPHAARLGQRQPPALGQRGAGDDPGPAVLVAQLARAETWPSSSTQPPASWSSIHACSSARSGPRRRSAPAGRAPCRRASSDGVEQQLEALDRAPAGRRRRRSGPASARRRARRTGRRRCRRRSPARAGSRAPSSSWRVASDGVTVGVAR